MKSISIKAQSVRRRTQRLRRIRFGIVLLVALVGLVLLPRMVQPQPRSVVTAGTSYTVARGDTMWSIAVQHNPSHDPRKVVRAIMAANELDSVDIQPGQVLFVPALSGGRVAGR